MYNIVFIDIDGTLVNTEKIVSDKTKEAIKKLKHNGIEVVLATGRAPFHFKEIADELGINAFVSFNGSHVVYKGKVIQSYPLKREYLETLINQANKNNRPLVFSGIDKSVCNYNDHPHVKETFESLKLNYRPDFEPDYWKENDIYQAMLYCEAEEEDFYRQSVADLSFVRWHELAMDVMSKGLSKAIGIQDMLHHFGFSAQEAVAFGDGLNDREMLEYVGMGVAMGNAHPDLISYADRVTRSVDEDGLAYALDDLGLI